MDFNKFHHQRKEKKKINMFIKLYERERARARPAAPGVWLVMCYFAVLCCPGLLLDTLPPPPPLPLPLYHARARYNSSTRELMGFRAKTGSFIGFETTANSLLKIGIGGLMVRFFSSYKEERKR